MNRKGFTLIELIVTIALLAVISLISFVSVSSAIKKNNINNCNVLVDNIKSAASEYVSDHRYDSGFTSGEDITINANTLIESNYLKGNITDPFTNEPINGSRIEVEIELNDDYTVKDADVKLDENILNCNNYYN